MVLGVMLIYRDLVACWDHLGQVWEVWLSRPVWEEVAVQTVQTVCQ
jgi:hypothetical protein